MATREELLALLRAIPTPIVEYAGSCVAGFDLDVATAEGYGSACCQAGSERVEGPVQLSKEDQARFGADAPPPGDDDDEDDGEVRLARAMAEKGCEPGKDYWYFMRAGRTSIRSSTPARTRPRTSGPAGRSRAPNSRPGTTSTTKSSRIGGRSSG